MDDPRRVVERFVQAIEDGYVPDAFAELIHPEITVSYPQSGEVIRGRDNVIAMARNYPGLPVSKVSEPHGGRQQVHVSTAMPFSVPMVTITGSGDTFFAESVHTYPDGGVYHGADIVKVRDGKVIELVSYFAAPFDPPDWRRPFVTS